MLKDIDLIFQKMECDIIDLTNDGSDDSDSCVVLSVSNLPVLKETNRQTNSSPYNTFYRALQDLVYDTPPEHFNTWKLLSKAVKICSNLKEEENRLLFEKEILLQENWKLKASMLKLTNKIKYCGKLCSKKKSLQVNLHSRSNDELAKPIVGENAPANSKNVDTSIVTFQTPPIYDDVQLYPEKTEQVSPQHKSKTNLPENEEEITMINSMLDRLLVETEALWNEVKDDEEWTEEDYKWNATHSDLNSLLSTPHDVLMKNNNENISSERSETDN